MIPTKTKKVKWACFKTAWGEAGLAWSEGGICRLVLPGLTKTKIIAELKGDDPKAYAGSEREIAPVIAQVRRYFQGQAANFDVALDLEGATDFQRKVYAVLRKIPSGETWSYGQVAKAAGQPGAGRAVGRANAANPIPLIIPCHRVVSADGGLGGYSGPGGPKTKARLLALEKKM